MHIEILVLIFNPFLLRYRCWKGKTYLAEASQLRMAMGLNPQRGCGLYLSLSWYDLFFLIGMQLILKWAGSSERRSLVL